MIEIIEQLAELSKKSIPVKEEDYVIDNLLYCGICNEPKEKILNYEDKEIKVRIECSCLKQEREDKERQERLFKKKQRADSIRQKNIPKEMWSWTFPNHDGKQPREYNASLKYVNMFDSMKKDGKGLMFLGGTGAGKTYFAACIANELIDRGYLCFITTFGDIRNKAFDDKSYIESLFKYDLLVIDDFGTESNTEYMNEIVFSVINGLYERKKCLVVTTNLSGTKIRECTDITKNRVYSRLIDMCIAIEVKGEDRRVATAKAERNKYEQLLGL